MDRDPPPPPPPKAPPKSAREARLEREAAALRANLRKRKDRVRALATAPAEAKPRT